jgi:integrase/recombinase XerD
MRALKHLPVSGWPQADRDVFTSAYEPGDVFDETAGPGSHLSEGSRTMIRCTYRRWLGFLKAKYPDDFSISPAERITPERVRVFIEGLSVNSRPSTVAIAAARLYDAARLIAPAVDWSWLRSFKSRLASRARPMDRFDRLVPPVQTLDFGIALMDAALTLPVSDGKQREIQYRDGLLLALLSIWVLRRRSIAALTVSRHLEFDDEGVNILLYPSDTKVERAESFRVPDQLVSYLMHYLKEIRPILVGSSAHDGLWASYRGAPLSAGRIYNMVRGRIIAKFGKAMGLHDFRRAAATYLAMDAPEKIGLIPGILQHASPDVGDQHYNLSRSVQAGRRFTAHLANARKRLRPLATQSGIRRADTLARPRRRIEIKMQIDAPARDDALRSSGTIKRRNRGEPSCA